MKTYEKYTVYLLHIVDLGQQVQYMTQGNCYFFIQSISLTVSQNFLDEKQIQIEEPREQETKS